MTNTTQAAPISSSNILPKRLQANVWLDAENLLRGLRRLNRTVTLSAFVKGVRAATANLVQVGQVYAYGDFAMLARIFRCNVQAELRRMNIHTVHLTSRQGKNTADMEIACDILCKVLSDHTPQSIVIGAGDRDFCPVVKTAHRQGIPVFVLSFADSISRDLANLADRVIFLDHHLPCS
jgi:uncharacterized LabA/DUF88 family protein